jgi:GNAT superfamily N-acetyltransferase
VAAFVTRRAGIQDVEALLWIQRQAAIAAFSHIFPQNRYPFPSEAIRDGWATALGDAEVEAYLAEVEARPVASVSIGHGFLRTLFVLPSHWGMGIGSELHDLALARLRARGVAEARLWTLADSESARRFYERRGWIETGETQVVPFPPHPLDVEYSLSLLGEA